MKRQRLSSSSRMLMKGAVTDFKTIALNVERGRRFPVFRGVRYAERHEVRTERARDGFSMTNYIGKVRSFKCRQNLEIIAHARPARAVKSLNADPQR